MSIETNTESRVSPSHSIAKQSFISKQHIVVGLIIIALGLFSVAFPIFSGMSLAVLLSFVLIFCGGALITFSRDEKTLSSKIFNFVLGLSLVVAGATAFFYPMAALLGMSAVSILLFGLNGLYGIHRATEEQRSKGWIFALIGGLISITFAVVLAINWPVTGFYNIGLLFGLRTTTSGIFSLI